MECLLTRERLMTIFSRMRAALIARFSAAISKDGKIGGKTLLRPARSDLRDVHRALAAMPLFVREVYLLRQVDKMSHAAIAERLGISRREVRRLLRLAVRHLDRASSRRRGNP